MVAFLRNFWQHLRQTTIHRLLQTAVGVWCITAAALLLIRKGESNHNAAFAYDLPLFLVVGCVLAGVLVIFLLNFFLKIQAEGHVFVGGVILFAVTLATRAESGTAMYVYYALALAMMLFVAYAASRGLLAVPSISLPRWVPWACIGVVFCLMVAVVAADGVFRHINYRTPNFDFGIFCQMFHNMKETGLPMTTLERDGLLSHFAVHISPIYYLLLPAYMLIPDPLTLVVAQAVVVASGVFPVYLLAKKLNLSTGAAVLSAVVYAAYPAIACGCLYDLHENCFLAPLLLWMFWFYECRKPLPMMLSAILVLMVKEDAAIYVAIFALYVMLSSRERVRQGMGLLGVAFLWFGVALSLLTMYGEGGMVGRYDAFIYGDTGLSGIVHTLIVNPGLFLERVFRGGDKTPFEKVQYLAQMVLPLGVALFSGKRFSRYLLVLPILFNLLSNWTYQTDITFQYSFGVSAFFVYLFLLNVADMPKERRAAALTYAAVSSVMLFTMTFVPRLKTSYLNYQTHKPHVAVITEALSVIPEDASVTAGTFFIPHLAQRDVVYEEYYHKEKDTDYLVLDLRFGNKEDAIKKANDYKAAGYVEVVKVDKQIWILKKEE